MSLLFMFPGQGAQRPGMLHALPSGEVVAATLDEASRILGSDCLKLDTAASLQSTVAVQLCLLIAGVAAVRLFAANQIVPNMVAGLSIGAFPAAVAAGALAFADAVRLVQRRAQLMERAYPSGYGMAAISGLHRAELEPILCLVPNAFLANLNAPTQLVIAGSEQALEQVMALALQRGAGKAQRLAVSVPSHCALLDAAGNTLRNETASLHLQRPALIYLSASMARALYQPDKIKEDLITNMARQVLWSDTSRLAWERGARLAIEMPGGSVLSNLVNADWGEGSALSFDNARLDTLLALAHRELNAG
ncbi:malonate decarboxylase epsilon subunit [Oxalobacteraceae bacterium GrIS 2.11]